MKEATPTFIWKTFREGKVVSVPLPIMSNEYLKNCYIRMQEKLFGDNWMTTNWSEQSLASEVSSPVDFSTGSDATNNGRRRCGMVDSQMNLPNATFQSLLWTRTHTTMIEELSWFEKPYSRGVTGNGNNHQINDK